MTLQEPELAETVLEMVRAARAAQKQSMLDTRLLRQLLHVLGDVVPRPPLPAQDAADDDAKVMSGSQSVSVWLLHPSCASFSFTTWLPRTCLQVVQLKLQLCHELRLMINCLSRRQLLTREALYCMVVDVSRHVGGEEAEQALFMLRSGEKGTQERHGCQTSNASFQLGSANSEHSLFCAFRRPGRCWRAGLHGVHAAAVLGALALLCVLAAGDWDWRRGGAGPAVRGERGWCCMGAQRSAGMWPAVALGCFHHTFHSCSNVSSCTSFVQDALCSLHEVLLLPSGGAGMIQLAPAGLDAALHAMKVSQQVKPADCPIKSCAGWEASWSRRIPTPQRIASFLITAVFLHGICLSAGGLKQQSACADQHHLWPLL